jgi:hypothetical protein
VRSRIIVAGDATATAANMDALESLWRLGVAGELLLLHVRHHAGGDLLHPDPTGQPRCLFCVVFGQLIYRSGYIPKSIGILMQIAGVSYLVNSFALVLSPTLSGQLFPLVLIPAFIGELSLALWLLVKGVNRESWNPDRSCA